MILNIDVLKEACKKILNAVDGSELSTITETLELKTQSYQNTNENVLFMNVTNKEYYAQVKIHLNQPESLHATVNANLFLKLIAQTTTQDIELYVSDQALVVKGNGNYKLPLIFEDSKLLELPEIIIHNPTCELDVSSDTLLSILNYNSKELNKGTISKPIQKLYYVDEQGAITFTSGACVNSFTLTTPIKVLLNNRIVKLFKLFNNTDVHVTLGFDPLSETIMQTKIRFESDTTVLTAIISCDDTLLNSVPVSAIRGRANNTYDYTINMDKDALLQTINRLLLFNNGYGTKELLKPYSLFEFKDTYMTVWDVDKNNNENIPYTNTSINNEYSATLDLIDLKTTLENCSEKYLTLSFGDHQAFVLSRGNIKNIIPEVKSL